MPPTVSGHRGGVSRARRLSRTRRREIASQGAFALNASRTYEERKAHARRAVAARWAAWRAAGKAKITHRRKGQTDRP